MNLLNMFSNKKYIVKMKSFNKQTLQNTGLFVFILLTTSLFLGGCQKISQPVSKSGYYFDTLITVSLYDTTLTTAEGDTILTDCFSLCEDYDNLLSSTKESSDIYKINHSKGQPVDVSEETIYLLKEALYYSELTGGLIDPTVATVSNLWDFSNPEVGILPDKAAISSQLTHVGYEKIMITDNTVTLSDPDTNIGLGFIAKGYIADQLKEFLSSQGITSAIINLGGNVVTLGSKPDGSGFSIGIQKPFDPNGTAITSLTLNNQSLVSSGNYERYFKIDSVIYHHILDPETGYPIQNNLYGVSILSDSSTQGDALSTTCYALGLTDGMALIESLDGVEAIFITDEYEIIYSSGLQQ